MKGALRFQEKGAAPPVFFRAAAGVRLLVRPAVAVRGDSSAAHPGEGANTPRRFLHGIQGKHSPPALPDSSRANTLSRFLPGSSGANTLSRFLPGRTPERRVIRRCALRVSHCPLCIIRGKSPGSRPAPARCRCQGMQPATSDPLTGSPQNKTGGRFPPCPLSLRLSAAGALPLIYSPLTRKALRFEARGLKSASLLFPCPLLPLDRGK